jgi:hypothetical protein
VDLETTSAGNEVDSDEDVEVEETHDMEVVESGGGTEEATQLMESAEGSGSMPPPQLARPDTLLDYDIEDPMLVTAAEMGEAEYAFEMAAVDGLRRYARSALLSLHSTSNIISPKLFTAVG